MADLYVLMNSMYRLIDGVSTFFRSTMHEVLTRYLPDIPSLTFVHNLIAEIFPWVSGITMTELFFGGGIILILVFRFILLIWPFGD